MRAVAARVLALVCVVIFTAACAEQADDTFTDEMDVRSIGSTLYALSQALWPDPSNIPVCWETEGFEKERGWVRDSIRSSWESAAPHVRFTGWESCANGASNGIHIVVDSHHEDGPHVAAFGYDLAGRPNGMTLDFLFEGNMFLRCRQSEAMRERCIRAIATHEFGHALGFLHEHERPDTPESCAEAEAALSPRAVRAEQAPNTELVGSWDLMSIMNYCYPDRYSVYPTALSPTDIEGVRQMYPPPSVVDPGDRAGEEGNERSTSHVKGSMSPLPGCSATASFPGSAPHASLAVLVLTVLRYVRLRTRTRPLSG